MYILRKDSFVGDEVRFGDEAKFGGWLKEGHDLRTTPYISRIAT